MRQQRRTSWLLIGSLPLAVCPTTFPVISIYPLKQCLSLAGVCTCVIPIWVCTAPGLLEGQGTGGDLERRGFSLQLLLVPSEAAQGVVACITTETKATAVI